VLPEVILHTVNDVAIGLRADNGYINVTALCQAGAKRWPNFTRLQECQDFIASLSRSTQIRADLLLETVATGPNEQRGTWAHPQLAIRCAMWVSADFAVQVTSWVEHWLTTRQPPLRGHDMGYYRAFLALVREVRELLVELEMYEDQDRLMLADHVRNVLLAARSQMAQTALPGASGSVHIALPEPPRVWTISERVLELGYPAYFTRVGNQERGHRYLIMIGKRLAQKYRQRYPGSDPKTSRRCVDGAQRPVATYRETDLDLMDAAIVEVLGPIERAGAGGV
jgi:hypothetical protein